MLRILLHYNQEDDFFKADFKKSLRVGRTQLGMRMWSAMGMHYYYDHPKLDIYALKNLRKSTVSIH